MIKRIASFVLFFALPAMAQYQPSLTGHVAVQSSTDSIGGQSVVVMNNTSDCTLTAQDNCTIFNATGLVLAGTDGPYVGTLAVGCAGSFSPGNLILPPSPGRQYNISNSCSSPLVVKMATGTASPISVPTGGIPVGVVNVGNGTTVGGYFLLSSSQGSSSPISIVATMPCTTSTTIAANVAPSDTTIQVASTACLNPTGGYLAIADPTPSGLQIQTTLEYVH